MEKEINPIQDYEEAYYLFLAKAQKNNVYNEFNSFMRKCAFLYNKRFGGKECMAVIPRNELVRQVADCIHNLNTRDEDTNKVLSIFKDANEQKMILMVVITNMVEK